MTYEQEQKKVKELSKRKNFKREDVEFIFEYISGKVTIESFSRVLDVKEEFGFQR